MRFFARMCPLIFSRATVVPVIGIGTMVRHVQVLLDFRKLGLFLILDCGYDSSAYPIFFLNFPGPFRSLRFRQGAFPLDLQNAQHVRGDMGHRSHHSKQNIFFQAMFDSANALVFQCMAGRKYLYGSSHLFLLL
jgi:hypothetical protein